MAEEIEGTREDSGPRQMLEEVAGRHGIDLQAVENQVEAGAEAEDEPAQPKDGEQPKRWEPNPHVIERLSRRKRMDLLEEENRMLREKLVSPSPAPKTPDPEPDFDLDPKAWQQWSMARALEPLLERDQQLREQEQQRLEQEQYRERALGALRERQELVRDLEGEYVATEEGKGFQGRFQAFTARLIAHYANYAPEGEDPTAWATHLTKLSMNGLVEQALHLGQNPSAFIDRHMAMLGQGVQQPAPRRQQQFAMQPPRNGTAPANPADTGLGDSLGSAPVPTGGGVPKIANANDLRALMREQGLSAKRAAELAFKQADSAARRRSV